MNYSIETEIFCSVLQLCWEKVRCKINHPANPAQAGTEYRIYLLFILFNQDRKLLRGDSHCPNGTRANNIILGQPPKSKVKLLSSLHWMAGARCRKEAENVSLDFGKKIICA